ncbi:MAG TPA: hypothetical protein VG452_02540, partial [Egibacteraceae bacterium]|nr:hypothetical protein [Egibacteraceae bacterium]
PAVPRAPDQPVPERPEVVFYPERVARAAPPLPLTPSQAVHLVDDPRRAAAAARTGQARRVEAHGWRDGDQQPSEPRAGAPQRDTRPRRWFRRRGRHSAR